MANPASARYRRERLAHATPPYATGLKLRFRGNLLQALLDLAIDIHTAMQ
jgi:hypothetical protein